MSFVVPFVGLINIGVVGPMASIYSIVSLVVISAIPSRSESNCAYTVFVPKLPVSVRPVLVTYVSQLLRTTLSLENLIMTDGVAEISRVTVLEFVVASSLFITKDQVNDVIAKIEN